MRISDMIIKSFEDSINAKKAFLDDDKAVAQLEKAADALVGCVKKGKKILVFGNGGSAADSQHMAAELVIRFEKDRKAIPCISLNTNVSNMTACGNDYSFDSIFSRQVEALADKDDAVVAISTSGNSSNVVEAVNTAVRMGLKTIALTGKDGGRLAGISDISIVVDEKKTARIQEVHAVIIHVLCMAIERSVEG